MDANNTRNNPQDMNDALSPAEKIEQAIHLLKAAMQELPLLKDIQFEPLVRSLEEGLRIVISEDSDLDLRTLMLKHEWYCSQRFYVRAVVRSVTACTFVVLPDQDIPEGIIIQGTNRNFAIRDGEHVALDLVIKRGVRQPKWFIRAVERE